MQPESAREVEPEFPSGPWTGFWTQPDRHRQDLHLTFRKGAMTGDGSDAVGRFTIRGRYDVKTKKAWWTKRYAGMHDVIYQGYRERKGIWGTWEIPGAMRLHGGFHIWPRGEGDGDQEQMVATVFTEVAAPAPAPLIAPGSRSPSRAR